jgi:hypothetical protein
MFSVRDIGYDLVALTPDGGQQSLRSRLTKFTIAEQQDAWSTHVSATIVDDITPGGQSLHQVVALGSKLLVRARWGDSGWHPLHRVTVTTWQYSDNGIPTLDIDAYDDLWFFLKSKSDFLFDAGNPAHLLLETILSEWGVPGGVIQGPNVTMPKMALRGTLADISKQILGEAFYQSTTEPEYFLRIRLDEASLSPFIDIIPQGTNSTVYWIHAGDNLTSMTDQWTIDNLVTEVLIVGEVTDTASDTTDDPTADPTEVPRPETRILYNNDPTMGAIGRLRDMVVGSKRDLSANLEKKARNLLDEQGYPEAKATFSTVDVPPMRRGDAVRITGGTMNGLYMADGIERNVLENTMTVTLDHARAKHYRQRKGISTDDTVDDVDTVEILPPDQQDPYATSRPDILGRPPA